MRFSRSAQALMHLRAARAHANGVPQRYEKELYRSPLQCWNRLRAWGRSDFRPLPDDLLQEKVYCIQWMRPKSRGKGDDYEFRSVRENGN